MISDLIQVVSRGIFYIVSVNFLNLLVIYVAREICKAY